MAENVSVVSNDNSNPNGSSANITPTSNFIYTGVDLFKDVIESHIGDEIGRAYASEIADGDDDIDTPVVRKEILDAITQTYMYHGQKSYDRKGNPKVSPLYKIPDTIPDTVVEHMAASCGKFAMILTSDSKAMLAVHFTKGKFAGLWRQVTDVQAKNTSPTYEFMEVQKWFQRWNKKIKGDALINAINNLMPLLPIREITTNDKYRCFINGLWEFTSDKDGFLTPWEDINPELTFSHKIPFRINTSPVLAEPEIIEPDGSVWKFTEWLHTIFNTNDECDAFMELMAAVISPYKNWKRLVMFLDGTGAATGNNGKSTLLDLLARALGGIQGGQVTSLPVSQFGEKYAFENALNSALIMSHENDETGKICGEALAKLKAIATDNEIEVTRKFKTTITVIIHALIVQAFNRLPSFGRTAENFERRLECFVFKNCFSGREKTYIADDYLKRPEVMEYILWYCIHKIGNIKELTKYDFFTENLSFFKTNTDSVTRFITEVLNNESYIKNDYISRKHIYEYYKSWYQMEYGTNLTCMSRPTFWDSWEVSVKFLKGWEYKETSIRIPSEYKVQFEPFLYDYKCVGGMDDDTKRTYHIYNERDFDVLPTASQKESLCTPCLSETIRGGIRRKKADTAA